MHSVGMPLCMGSHLLRFCRTFLDFYIVSMVKRKGNEHWTMGSSITLSKMGYSALNRVQAVSKISSLVPGSCPPNWLHGKANISKPTSGKNNTYLLLNANAM